MAAGTVDHEAGTRDVGAWRGLARDAVYRRSRWCWPTVSMAGLPPLIGFISKELIYEGTLAISPVAGAA